MSDEADRQTKIKELQKQIQQLNLKVESVEAQQQPTQPKPQPPRSTGKAVDIKEDSIQRFEKSTRDPMGNLLFSHADSRKAVKTVIKEMGKGSLSKADQNTAIRKFLENKYSLELEPSDSEIVRDKLKSGELRIKSYNEEERDREIALKKELKRRRTGLSEL